MSKIFSVVARVSVGKLLRGQVRVVGVVGVLLVVLMVLVLVIAVVVIPLMIGAVVVLRVIIVGITDHEGGCWTGYHVSWSGSCCRCSGG